MNQLKDNDIREALRRKEERRTKPQVSSDFFDRVMQDIEPPKRKRPISSVVSLLAVAASVAIVLMMVVPSKEQQKHEVTSTVVKKSNVPQVATPQQQQESFPTKVLTAKVNDKKTSKRITLPKNTEAKENSTASVSHVDSLEYYIDKIEQELAQVDESLYIERINKVIQADERLQRIVDQYILQRISDDDKPQEAHSINPQTINNYEE